MDEYRIRVRIFIGIIVAMLGILGLRLAQLQILDVEEYAGESRSNAVREVRVQPSRGAIYDRLGILMVDNEPSYTITITPRTFEPGNVSLLARLLEVPDSVVVNKLSEARAFSSFQPNKAFREVPFDIFSRVIENLYRLPGVGYAEEFKRRYHTTARAAHAFGYIREIGDAELERFRDQGYRQGDLIGKAGIERNYEGYLRGRLGAELKMVNVHGLEVKSYQDGVHDVEPLGGFDLHVGIDAGVQMLAESLFVGKRGAAIALDPNSGAIIAMLSRPDFDPELFSQSVDQETWRFLTTSLQKPLYNRSTQNLLPPGSTWKPFMALMSLQEGNISPTSTVYCGGGHPIGGGRFFRCMKAHGTLNVLGAIRYSCNTFFFEMMNRTDPNTFSKYAHAFGFGEQAPTDIMEQTAGLIPDSVYFVKRWGQAGLKPGFTLNLGIGQGDMGVTPLQLARYVAAVGNKGKLYPPHLVTRLVHPETGEVVYPALPAPRQIPIEEQYFDLAREGMKKVMEEGTGYWVQIPGITAGGKTG
ncbi:MAG: penicillin-binding protein 2, partial [Rhodothermales bacterium]